MKDAESGMDEATRRKNDKQAAEYIRRLANGQLPEMKVAVNYFEAG